MGEFCVPKPLVGVFGCDKLVLYGIKLLVKQILDMELDNPDCRMATLTKRPANLPDKTREQ